MSLPLFTCPVCGKSRGRRNLDTRGRGTFRPGQSDSRSLAFEAFDAARHCACPPGTLTPAQARRRQIELAIGEGRRYLNARLPQLVAERLDGGL
jgi:hypothetical protein